MLNKVVEIDWILKNFDLIGAILLGVVPDVEQIKKSNQNLLAKMDLRATTYSLHSWIMFWWICDRMPTQYAPVK